jgi:GNAT superfamily N-acetyltransferase
MNFMLNVDDKPKAADIEKLQKGIDQFNVGVLKQSPKAFAIFLRDEDSNIRGGVYALSYTDQIHIIMLWVEEKLRSHGYGAKLIKAAEEEGVKRKCKYSYVDTFGFQAKGFYMRCGYQLLGKINNALFDYSRIFFRKSLLTENKLDVNISQIDPMIAEIICRDITADLPEYFGIPEANERYAKGMLEHVSFSASIDNKYVGLLTLESPFSNNANIYWMAVKRNYQGMNIGSLLVEKAENYCREKDYMTLTVETLSPKNEDENYLKTYQFYEKCGFNPLFELNTYGPEFLMVYLQKTL